MCGLETPQYRGKVQPHIFGRVQPKKVCLIVFWLVKITQLIVVSTKEKREGDQFSPWSVNEVGSETSYKV